MRIRTIKTRIISMTANEHAAFIRALEQAKEGRTVHSGSVELDDGSQLCVCVQSQEEIDEREKAARDARNAREEERRNRY
jgi:hypothetical protein